MRLLIISPHFPPTNAADMQRVRLILPYLHQAGVEAEVLSVEPAQVAAPQDAWLAAGLPATVPIHRVTALGLAWTKVPGLGVLSFRALEAIRRRGDELLGRGRRSGGGGRRSKFDLVYFSTTQFGVHVLGPRWKKKFGVPFVMDYQDPWVSDYYREHPAIVPPGGRLKYSIVNWLNRRQEPRVLRECSGITSVSAAYSEQLAKRYAWLSIEEFLTAMVQRPPSDAENKKQQDVRGARISGRRPLPSLVLPFPGDALDLERVKRDCIRQSVFDPNDGLKHWVYVGRGGADMALAVRGLFTALHSALRFQPSSLASLRLHFIGTSYAAAGQGTKTIEPLAREYGLEAQVIEHPDRIPYSETLRCLLDADALIIPGSDDPGYTASKIYPYLLAEKPLLAVFHERSSVVDLMHECGGGTVVTFSTGEAAEELGRRIAAVLGLTSLEIPQVPLDGAAFEPHTARSQAQQLSQFCNHCLKENAV